MSNYDPAENSVEDVKAHVEKNPKEASAVLEAEKARGDDARKTLVAHLEKTLASQEEAPESVDAQAVTVEPAAAPSLLDQFEVTPERGHRKKS